MAQISYKTVAVIARHDRAIQSLQLYHLSTVDPDCRPQPQEPEAVEFTICRCLKFLARLSCVDESGRNTRQLYLLQPL